CKIVISLRRRHPVDDHFAGCRSCRNDKSARAHAKGVDSAAVDLMHQAIGGSRKQFIALALAIILDGIDYMLRMFYTYAHGEGFGFQRYLFVVEEVKDIPGRMTSGQDSPFHGNFGSIF